MFWLHQTLPYAAEGHLEPRHHLRACWMWSNPLTLVVGSSQFKDCAVLAISFQANARFWQMQPLDLAVCGQLPFGRGFVQYLIA